jgi:hypothetical protein
MCVGSGITISRRAGLAGYLAGALALGAVAVAGTVAAHATETLKLKTAISIPGGGKITSFDISFVDTATGTYVLGDRTNKGIDVIDTATNTVRFIAGQGLFAGSVLVNGVANNDISGPDGVMITPLGEIWAGDGDSTIKFLSLFDGAFLDQIATSTTPPLTRVDEMCFDSFHYIGFVANNAASPPFVTAVDAFTHQIIGQIVFDGTNGTPNATNGIEQCAFNPRDGKIYLAVPEINGPGNNSVSGGVSRINPLTLQVETTFVIPHAACAGPQGLAIGPVVGNYGEMLTGCNGAVANAGANRPTALIDDGSQPGGTFGNAIALPFQAGNDMVTFNAADNHYYLARSGNNSFANRAPDPITGVVYGCPNVLGATNYGGAIFTGANSLDEAFGPNSSLGARSFAGPSVLGMVNALTLENDPDTITGLFNCAAANPGPGGVGKAGVANAHGAAHSVAADSAHNQIYVPIASTAFATGMTGLCAQGGGVDANGCIAVFQTVGSDP